MLRYILATKIDLQANMTVFKGIYVANPIPETESNLIKCSHTCSRANG